MSIPTPPGASAFNQLVPVFLGKIGGVQMHVCDARTLHAFLENGDEFAHWIKDRIKKYEFIENQDFAIVWENSQAKRGGHNRKDYYLALDMARELSMVENNEKGREARRYFIDCERRLRETAQSRAQNLLTDELQSAINQEAHTLALRSFGPIRAALSELARQHLERGESPLEVVGRVRKGFPGVGDMLVIQAAELWQLTSALAGCAAALEGPMDALHRLEARTGRDWYPK
ncbi:Phage anti-repressor protein [Methylomagnum ishizawai]|uniref:Phage anti-repressor protein n=1 Tax=Methylomagnum ishizawai TaxID=1760988 RepID=A0A1Y6DB06_9GAMM|nr:antA/AntB antirepressor family protein [Methylomagnum ishizawai]SMF97793.1 Phage anti-repressor protein [Methylomagnum ishizawai]